MELLVARALLLWPDRVEAQATTSEDIKSITGSALTRDRFESYVRLAFGKELDATSSTDIWAMYDSFLRRRKGLFDWYAALFEASDITVGWRESAPRIPLDRIREWTLLSNDFDVDGLLTFYLSWKKIGAGHAAATLVRFHNWQTLPRPEHHELDVVGRSGLSDMHVHVGGVRIPQSAWLSLLEGGGRQYSGLASAYRRSGRSFGLDTAEARMVRKKIATALKLDTGAGLPVGPGISPGHWWNWSPKRLFQERVLLLEAWKSLSQPADPALPALLDLYLSQKNRFYALAKQPAFTEPAGLDYFATRYFRTLSPNSPRTLWRKSKISYSTSTRLAMAPFGDACSYLLESADLQRVELRIGPFERAPDYWRFFKQWRVLRGQLDAYLVESGRKPVDFRFAFHFKRSRAKKTSQGRSSTWARLSELDKHTAALCVALACPTRSELLSDIGRIDVAGQERDTSLVTFSWHLRLFREDPEAILALEQGILPPPWNQNVSAWSRLAQREAHKFHPNVRRLGVTVHAGEDYADPLDGLYQIASAVDFCKLRSGDGIGHGLALVDEDFSKSVKAQYVAMPLGEMVDQLCWLKHALEGQDGTGLNNQQTAMLDGGIINAAEALYREIPDFLRTLKVDDLMWLWRTKTGLLKETPTREPIDKIRKSLLELEADESFWVIRDRIELAPSRQEYAAMVAGLQRNLLKRVCELGIVLELNPSSNLRISGARSTKTNPAVLLAKAMAQGLQACVNTDNPGVFTSCIENEFALLLDGLRRDGSLNAREIRDCINMARDVGMNYLK